MESTDTLSKGVSMSWPYYVYPRLGRVSTDTLSKGNRPSLDLLSTSKVGLSNGVSIFQQYTMSKVSLHSTMLNLDRTDEYFVFIIVIHE